MDGVAGEPFNRARLHNAPAEEWRLNTSVDRMIQTRPPVREYVPWYQPRNCQLQLKSGLESQRGSRPRWTDDWLIVSCKVTQLRTDRRDETRRDSDSRPEDSSWGSSKRDSREGQVKKIPAEGQVKKTPVEGQVKETPGRVKWRRRQRVKWWLQ